MRQHKGVQDCPFNGLQDTDMVTLAGKCVLLGSGGKSQLRHLQCRLCLCVLSRG